MGGRHRSQHFLLPLLKVGSAAHNNELGNRGRRRSKTSGTYPPPRRPTTIPAEDLKDDPTVKPTAMLEDTLLDLTIVATIVVDPFLGLGSTRVAADNPAACAVASSWTSSMTM
jgi:DNA modification methylase